MIENIEILAQLPCYTEGPVMDAEGNLYCTTMTGGYIVKIDKNRNVSNWASAVYPNGQVILDNGDHLVCDYGFKAISRFSKKGIFLGYDIKGSCGGSEIHAPNDITVDAEGGIFFTDSVRESGKVFYYKPGADQKVIAKDLDFPNGLALSNDQKLLYVAESYKNRILVFDLQKRPANRAEVFADLPSHPSGNILRSLPDGLKADNNDCVWVAHYGMSALQVLSPSGQLIKTIDTTLQCTSNLFLASTAVIVTGGNSESGPGSVLKIAYS